MGYRLVDVDVSGATPVWPHDEEADGFGVLLRDGRRPLGFLMVPASGARPGGTPLAELVATAGAQGLLAERLRRALLARADAAPVDPPPPPAVTVAICTRNRPDDLAHCLDSVLAGDVRPADVLVVDNCPPDERTRGVAARFAGVRYVREPVAGLDVARNRALREAHGDWIAFVDDDVRVDRGWLAGFAAALVEHPDAGAVTGLVLPAELETEAQVRFERRGGFGRGYEPRRWDGRNGPGNRLHPLGAGEFGAGCNMAFDVAVMRSLGGFDEALDTGPPLPGGGDLDAFYRVLDAGHVLVYEPRMAVFHRHRRGMDELRGQYRSWGSGFAAYLDARWADPRERTQVMRMIVWWLRYQARRVAGGARRRDPHQVRMALAELAGGVTGLPFGYARSRRRMAARRAAASQPDTTTSGSRTPEPSPLTRGTPQPSPVIRHVDLREGLPPLADPDGVARRWYLWWGDRPLGVLPIEAWQLPVSRPRLARLAAAAVSDAVGDLLYPSTVFAAPLPDEAPTAPRPVPLADLLALDVTSALDAVVERPAAPVVGACTAAVVVCTRDRPEQLRRCLRALRGLERPPDELVVVDNAPRGDATRRVADEEGVRYVLEPRPGLSHARNAGIAATTADVIAFTDDDVVVHPGWLGRLLAAFGAPDVMAVTGLVFPGALDSEAHRVFEDVVGGFGQGFRPWEVGPEWFHRHRRRPPHVWRLGAGASAAFRRAAFDRVGGFDERLGAGAAGCSEDSELWYRLLAGGWRCRYEPWAVAHHFHRDSLPELRLQAYRYMRGHVAALAVQAAHTRQLGEPRRMLATLPRHYLSRGLRRLWWRSHDQTLAAEARGYLAGLVRAPAMVRPPRRPAPIPSPIPSPIPPAPVPAAEAGKAPLPVLVASNPFPHPRTLGLFYGEKMRAIHTVSPERGVGLVVEVGGGQSGLAAALYPCADVLTVDLETSFGHRHDLYGATARDTAPRRRFAAGDATALPIADGMADVVTLFDVLEHVPDDATAVSEALRILRPGGHLLLTTPADTWRFPFYRAYRRWTPTDMDVMAAWGHVRRGYQVTELDRLVGRPHDALATFITPVTVVAHDLAFSRLPQPVKRVAGLALAPVVWPASRLHRPGGVGTEVALRWTIS